MRIAIAALALLLPACAQMQWVKEGAAPAQLQADLAQCEQYAWQESFARSMFYYPMAPAVVHDSLSRRMHIYPYGPFADPFGYRFMEEGRLANFCMRSKGWQLEEVPKPGTDHVSPPQAETIQPSPAPAPSAKP